MRRDPMDITLDHIAAWRTRFDQLGSSTTKDGKRKTFELNPAGDFVVREHYHAETRTLYRGGDEVEAVRVYNNT